MVLLKFIWFFRDTYINQEETELVNDYNDRCIRKACMWYMLHLKDKKFILLTEDVANKQIAKELKICVSNGSVQLINKFIYDSLAYLIFIFIILII